MVDIFSREFIISNTQIVQYAAPHKQVNNKWQLITLIGNDTNVRLVRYADEYNTVADVVAVMSEENVVTIIHDLEALMDAEEND